ncbi:rod shape-determining protein MreD [Candidatus Pelagibacter bacterium]|nr:rod shape-determining protein MreD [Candidatus Pelagibacter bacterium]|tara:strand:+ start:1807 stop:2325 length:519 start_codon:yes stop_codon:yes gene_type:complete
MSRINQSNIIVKLYTHLPIILLFISVLNESDFNNMGLKYFSFNFSFILIFYFSVKKSNSLGYVLVFIAGLFNDVVLGLPIGISSLIFLLLCGAAAYLRNITLRPNLMKDWIFFLISILIIKSIFFLILTFIFNYEIDFLLQVVNIIFTFLLYICFSYLFQYVESFFAGRSYD